MLPRMPPTPASIKREREEGTRAPPAPGTIKTERAPPGTIKTEREPVTVEVKREPGRVRPALPSSPPPAPKIIPPWAVKPELVVKREAEPGGRPVEIVRIVPVVPSNVAPWSRPEAVPPAPSESNRAAGGASVVLPPVAPAEPPSDHPAAAEGDEEEEQWLKRHYGNYHIHHTRALREMPGSRPFPSNVMLQAKNYAAVDPSRKVYGLIDRGRADAATRLLIMHVCSKHKSFPVFQNVRPGELLPAVSKSNRGGTTLLRVRYITPAQYYAPGVKVSSMAVGVDEADWQSLVAKAHRI
jgi:hypothetical protein